MQSKWDTKIVPRKLIGIENWDYKILVMKLQVTYWYNMYIRILNLLSFYGFNKNYLCFVVFVLLLYGYI